MCILMKGGSMNTFLKKILMVLASMKSIITIGNNSQPETYCQKLKREKREEALREQEGGKGDSGGFAY